MARGIYIQLYRGDVASITPAMTAGEPFLDTTTKQLYVSDATTTFQIGSTWRKFTKTYTNLSAAATTNDIEILSLAAKQVIEAVVIKHSAAFTGGAIIAYTVSVGITGNLTKYAGAFDVFQAPGNTVFQISSVVGMENYGAATSIRLAATSTVGLLNAATAGSVDVWIKTSLLT